MSTRWQRVRETFEMICDLDAGARTTKLAEVSRDDPTLCADVESLLASYDEGATALDFLPTPGTSDALRQGAATDRIGQDVGSYRLIARLAIGGMSTVYLGERTDAPSEQRVAIKIITTIGPLPQRFQKRFLHERRMLAKLDHPNIARLLHGGVTDDGWPYLVMEYIDGKPIDEYCDEQGLSIDGRIAVFRDVCAAVQYAHQNLVVHRDLKPSNILVTPDGVPKLLDFGIAKLLQDDYDLQRGAVPTTEQFMTPEYASPEQIRGASITTASDVYSLGVVLYQLLTGRQPHSFKTRLVYEIARIVCDEDPLKPSIAASQTDDAPHQRDLHRRTAPVQDRALTTRKTRNKIGPRLAGDMDAIVMRAMRKEPGSRYSSADQFADDLGRYLQGLPVRARKGTWRYRASKFVRRNRTGVVGLAAVFVALVAGGATSTWFAIQAGREARAATAARDEATRQAAFVLAVNDFLNTDLLAAAAPEAQGKDVSMRSVLDAASKTIATKFKGAPLIEASVRTTLGNTYMSLGEYDIAASHYERALSLRRAELGENHLDTLDAMAKLAELYMHQGRYEKSEPLLVRGLEASRRLLGEEHPTTLDFMSILASLWVQLGRYDEAEPLHAKALDANRRLRGEDHPDTLACMNKLAQQYVTQGRYDEAEPLLVKSLEANRRVLGEDHSDSLVSMTNLAELYTLQGRFDEAESLQTKGLELSRRALGEEHPTTLSYMNNLAELFNQLGRYDEAVPLLEQALEVRLRVLGNNHPHTLTTMMNLALLYDRLGRYGEAEDLYTSALEGFNRVLGEDHQSTLATMGNLSELYRKQGKYDEAESLRAKVLKISLRVLGEDHPNTISAMNNMALLYFSRGKYDEAEPLYLKALETSRRVLGEDHFNTLIALHNLACLYRDQARYSEADPLFVELLEGCRPILGDEHPLTMVAQCNQAQSFADQGRYEEAEPLFVSTLEAQRRVLGQDHLYSLTSMTKLARLYTDQERFDDAEPLCADAFERCRRVLGEDHPITLEATANLATLLGHDHESERAEQLFRRVLELQSAKLSPNHPNVWTTMTGFADLLLSEQRLDEAESLYQAVLEALVRTGRGESHRAQTVRENLAVIRRRQDHDPDAHENLPEP